MSAYDDFTLVQAPTNVRASNRPATPKATIPFPISYKTELQVIHITDGSHKSVMDALIVIHGSGFKLDDKGKYKDRGGNSMRSYWKDRGTLMVQSVSNFSANARTGLGDNILGETERLGVYPLLMLENYGFDTGHCKEALVKCNEDTGEALLLLYKQYMRLPDVGVIHGIDVPTTEELLIMRNEEKEALSSIYGNDFSEKEHNSWCVVFQAQEHLMAYSPEQVRKTEAAALKAAEAAKGEIQSKNRNRPLCRNYKKNGKCNFGERCRFLHAKENVFLISTEPNWCDGNENPVTFTLDFRFPPGSRYPFEAPYVCMKTSCDIPKEIRLRISKNLYKEAVENCQNGIGCVFAVCQLFQSEECVSKLSSDDGKFPSPQHSLFYVETEDDPVISQKDGCSSLPTHYEPGQIARAEGGFKDDAARVDSENRRIMKQFLEKQTNEQYQVMIKTRMKLPAYSKRTEILDLIKKSPVLVISGETGCGKSTQVPQFILDEWFVDGGKNAQMGGIQHLDIYCTQPRRLSAISLAARVSAELADRLGNIVGYQIRLDSKVSSSTRLTFCTTGILLRKIVADPLLSGLTHIIIDEVHERSDESDFLLLIVKRILKVRKDLKVILMSATVNSTLFSNYFDGAPILTIPGRTFPVEEFFLEDILEMCPYVLELNSTYTRKIMKHEEIEFQREMESAGIESANVAPPEKMKDELLNLAATCARYSNYSKTTCETIYHMAPMMINLDLIESVLSYIIDGDHDWPRVGSILVFLPGSNDIMSVLDALTHSTLFVNGPKNLLIVPLHSTLSNEEQCALFRPVPEGKRRIILSTNIAETSITIDDCVFVIDCGLMKEKRFDPNRNMESLDLSWVSRANAKQRKGRAGRVMSGICIKLYTSNRYFNQFLSQPVPELQRIPLDQLVLRIKTMQIFNDMNPSDVLNETLEPPNLDNIINALSRLRNVGALNDNNELTPLGHHLSALPVDVRIGKLMLYGTIFQCLDSVLTLAACLNNKSPFLSPFNKRNQADKCKRQFATCNSDHLTIIMAYKKWLNISKLNAAAGRNYANENFLSLKTLQTIADLKYQFLELLVSIGFVPINVPRKRKNAMDNILELTGAELNINGENNKLLVSLLCGALYPNVVKVMTPERSYVETASGAMPKPYTSRELRFKTRFDGYVHIHPRSVNSLENAFKTPFLVFQEKIRTSSIFVHDCSMLPLVALVLFAGSDFKVELQDGKFLFLLDEDWIVLKAHDFQTAEEINILRKELFKLLEEKIKDPYLDLMNNKNAKTLINTIVYVISNNN